MIQNILKYALLLNAKEEVFNWINTAAKNALLKQKITESELEHVLDYLVSSAAPPRLQKMSVVDAKRKTDEWAKANQKKGKNLSDSDDDVETIHDFFDGTRIVKLKSKKAYEREGFLMSHCVGGYNPSNYDCHIYSYRDAKNMPHATFEARKSGNQVVQIKGKGNGPIHPKYIHPILAFLKSIGMEIRSSDMKNLGYYHIHKDHLEFLQKSEAWEQVCMINGEAYAHS